MSQAPLATVRLERCLACGSAALEPLALRYEFRGGFPLVECNGCGLRFLAVQPAREALAGLYSAEYFERDFRCGRSDSDVYDEATYREEDNGLLDAFARHRATGRLLEVGCAAGWLLKHAGERGWKAEGVELSETAVTHARSLGLEVHQGELHDAALPGSSFDLVYMGDVLEHVPDCRGVLAEVARLLRPGGVLYLRGPATTHSIARGLALRLYGALGRDIVLHEPPYHLWEFTPRPLAALFRAVGLEVVECRQSKIPPGSAHGQKSTLQRFAMAVLDAVNLPITNAFNVLGDRLVMVGRKRDTSA